MKRTHQISNEILLDISNEIARIRGKEDMLQLIRYSLKKFLRFNDSFIMRYKKSTRTCTPYIFFAEESRSENPAFGKQLNLEYPIQDDSVLDNTIPEVCDVESMIAAGNDQVQFIYESGIKEFVTIRLVEGNELIGLFVLLSENKNSFTPESLALLKNICYPISIATANIIANEEISKGEEEKNLLLFLSNEIAALKNRNDLMHIVNEKIKKLFSIRQFGIFKVDEDGETYSGFIMDLGEEITAHANYNAVVTNHYAVSDPFFTEVMNAEEPGVYEVDELVRQPDMPAYVHFWKSSGIKQVLIVSLRVGGMGIGTAVFILEKDAQIDTGSVLLKGVCSQLAVAVSNILANEKLEKRESEKSILLSLSKEMAALKTREDLFNVVNSRIKELFSVSEFGIAQLDESGQTYSAFALEFDDRTRSHPEFTKITAAKYPVTDPIFSKLVHSEEPVFFNVAEVSVQEGMPEYVAFWKKAGFRYYLTVPLRVGGRFIGFVNFHVESPKSISAKSMLLQGVCDQLALAISNILANERINAREEEKNLLLSLSNEMAALKNRLDLFKVVNGKIKQLLGIKELGFSKIDEGGSTYSIFLVDVQERVRNHPDFDQILTAHFDVRDPLFTEVIHLETPIIYEVDQLLKLPDMPPYVGFWKETGIERVATYPLRTGGAVIGTALFILEKNAEFNISNTLLVGVCSQLAVTISNILSTEKIKEREAEKSMLLEFSNAIASVQDKYVFAIVLKEQLKMLFAIEDYVINVLSEDQKSVIGFLFDSQNKIFSKQEFLKLLDQPIDVNDGIFNRILESSSPIKFRIEDWAKMKKPPVYLEAARATGLEYMTGVRLRLAEKNIAFISFKHDKEGLPHSRLHFLQSICSQISIAVANILANEKISRQLLEIEKYRQQLEEEKIYLKEEIETNQNYSEIIGDSPEIKKVFRLVNQVAHTDSTVLILGETGTGKELIARAIHNGSPRRDRLMIKINCAALPVNLIESELFGHERGSFTGALDRRVGKFELANHGTLFLDEIGEMPLELQVKLLRALQEKEIERIGGKTTIKTDVRIIAATNRDLEKLMEEGKFRSDLYYRLNIFPIQLPPLRERREDIPTLAAHFMRRFSKKAGKKINSLGNNILQLLMNYDWPGNIRELEHLIERSVLLADGDTIKDIYLPNQKSKAGTRAEPEKLTVKTIFENEKEYILKVLKHVNGRIAGEGGAADLLGIPPSTLNSKMKKLGIRREHRSN